MTNDAKALVSGLKEQSRDLGRALEQLVRDAGMPKGQIANAVLHKPLPSGKVYTLRVTLQEGQHK
jgi:hypothetical protein